MKEVPSAGEPAEVAIPRLAHEHGPRLFALASRFCASPEEAEDLVQEVLLTAWRKWSQFDGRSRPETWLYRIAARACQRMHRKRSGEPQSLLSLDERLPTGEALSATLASAATGADPAAPAQRNEERGRLEAAIRDLPEALRMPLVLKEIVGFPVREVAAILELKEATVKTRLHRARGALREGLGPAPPPPE